MRNRTVVTTTTQRRVPGGTRVLVRNTTTVRQFPGSSVSGSTVRQTTLTETSSSSGGASLTGQTRVEGSTDAGSRVTETSERRSGVTGSSVTGSTSGSLSGSSLLGSGSGTGSSSSSVHSSRYRNESRRVSSGSERTVSESEYAGVQSRRGGGRWTGGRGGGGVTQVTNYTKIVTSWTGGSGGSRTNVTRVVKEERISRKELQDAYRAKNRLEQFGGRPRHTVEVHAFLPRPRLTTRPRSARDGRRLAAAAAPLWLPPCDAYVRPFVRLTVRSRLTHWCRLPLSHAARCGVSDRRRDLAGPRLPRSSVRPFFRLPGALAPLSV